MTDVLLSPIRLSELEVLIENSVRRAVSAVNITEPVEKLMTISEASGFLDLAIPTIYTKVHLGEIPFHKTKGSKKLRFSRQELLAWQKSKS